MSYKLLKTDDGLKIQAVEIFKLNNDRGFDFNKDWFDKAQRNHAQFSADGFNPPVIVGHNKVKGVEKTKLAGFSNLALKPDGITVTADYLLETDGVLNFFEKFPQRSVEVCAGPADEDNYFSAIAQLGGTEPHFKFPDLKVEHFHTSDGSKKFAMHYEGEAEMAIEAIVERDEKQEKLWSAWWALRQKIDDIFSSKDIADTEKPGKISSAVNEWAALAKEILGAETTEFHSMLFANIEKEVNLFSADRLSKLPAPPAPAAKTPEQIQFEKDRDQLRTDRLDFNKKKLDSQFEELAKSGLCNPVLDNLRALREAVLHEPFQSLKVTFQKDKKTTEVDFAKLFDDTFEQIRTRALAGNLIVPVKPTVPADNSSLEFQNTSEDGILNSIADAIVKEELKKRGFGLEKYQEVFRELLNTGKITFDKLSD